MAIRVFYISLTLSFFASIGQGYGQASKIEIIARAQEDKILLRWAPIDFSAWHYLNKYGYTLERYTVTKDSALVTPPTKIIMGKAIKPKPLNEWETFVDNNDYAAIAAQVLYGETIEISINQGSDISQIIQKTKEQEQRFSFGLFAADQSFEVAEMAGLGFADLNAIKGEKYLYKVISNVPDSIALIDEGTAFVGLVDYIPLPQPLDFEGEFGNNSVILSWNRSFFERIYNSFIVERSDDGGKTFLATSNKPLINTYEGDDPKSDNYYKQDSLPENGKVYHFRIRGITSFGEMGPPSEVIKGMGKTPFQLDLGITKGYAVDNDKVVINWQVVDGTIELIREYLVERSDNTDGPFNRVNIDLIEKEKLAYVDEFPRSTNYYRVTALSIYDDKISSFPYLVQLADSIPPAIPLKLEGKIDSLGIVEISWQANTESDLFGYRVYRSNFKNSEFGQVTKEPVTAPYFKDTVSINTLTSSIYYKVMAVDKRFNPSALSLAVALKRPDIIPPTAPVFKSIKSVDEGIAISWINSSSKDVAAHVMYKQKAGDSDWSLYKKIVMDTIQSLIDTEVQSGVYYNYTMIAIDSSNLESLPANKVRGVKVDKGIRAKIENVKAYADRTNKSITIRWKYNEENVKEILIYRKSNEDQLTLYTALVGDNSEFIDQRLKENTYYSYRIKAVFENGSFSEWSDEIKVKF
jgi:uncharacterized protein